MAVFPGTKRRSACCAITPSIAFFHVYRAVRGISAAACVALSYAIIASKATDRQESIPGMEMLTVESAVAPPIAPGSGSQVRQ
ncbi:hypothetical protein CF640_37445, partial [Burkholderia pseudomallei]